MAVLNKKNKDRLINGLITIVLLLLGLWVKSLFKEDPLQTKQETNILTKTNQLKDSAHQDNLIVHQKLDSGTINNDFSKGKQITTNNNFYSAHKKDKLNKIDTTILNNGFLNQGGTGNTYNQTINPATPHRNLSEQDKIWFQSNLPKRKVDFYVSIYNYDKESMNLAHEIENYLQFLNYNLAVTPTGEILGAVPQNKLGQIDLEMATDSSSFQIFIYPLN